MSTLSVEISTSASSTATESPTFLSQRVTVPSVTDSPSAGRVTSVVSPPAAAAAGAATGSAAGAAGASVIGAGAGASATWAGAGSGSGSGSAVAGAAAGAAGAAAAGAAPASESEPMRASTAPTSMVASSSARISSRVPATGEGISVSTLSVEISTSGSSTATVSPTFLSQRVTVPSVTDSPSAGRVTSVLIGRCLRLSRAREVAYRREQGALRQALRSGWGVHG